MSVFLQSIQGVLVILVMVAIGYGLASAKWFTDKSGQIIARIVTQVALPMYMVNTITHDFTKGELIRLLPEIKFPIISMLVFICNFGWICTSFRYSKKSPWPFSINVFQFKYCICRLTNKYGFVWC